MRFRKSFWLGILVAEIMGFIVVDSNCTLATPASSNLRKIAEGITVSIQEVTCESREEGHTSSCDPKSKNAKFKLQGSGVIIAKNKNTYYVLTAKHVVRNMNSYQIITPDNKAYLVEAERVNRIEGSDLAVVPFSSLSSKKVYTPATLFTYCAAEKWQVLPPTGVPFCQSRESLRGNLKQQDFPQVLVAGYVDNSTPRKLRLEFGVLKDRNFKSASAIAQSPFNGGYEYIHTNQTQDRMSGGPILDPQGRVVGIHGQLDGEGELAYGYSLGIPIDTFLLWLTRYSSSLEEFGLLESLEIEGNMSFLTQLPPTEVAVLLGGESPKCSRVRNQNPRQIVELSNRFYKLGKTQEALDCVEIALNIDHSFRPALFAKGFLLIELSSNLGNNKYSDALKSLESLTIQNPDAYFGWRWMGEALLKLEHYDKAVEAFNNAIEGYKKRYPDEDFYQAWSGKAFALTKLGKVKDAVAAQEIASFENGFSGLIALGEGKFLTEDFEGARKAYEKAIDLKKSDPDALIGLGRVLIQLKQYELASKKLEAVTNKSEKSGEFNPRALSQGWFELGREYEQLSKLNEALNYYGIAIKASPSNYQAWFYQGIVQYKLGLYNQAYNSFSKAQNIRSDSQTAINLLLDIQTLQRLCERYSNNGLSLYTFWGGSLSNTDTSESSLSNTKASFSFGIQTGTSPPNPSERNFTSSVSSVRVRASSDRSTRCKPNSELADLKLEPIQPIEASDYISESDWDLLWEGLDKKYKGDYVAAIEAYDKAIKINQHFYLAYFHRGILRKILKDTKGAEEDLNQAIRLKPDYAEAYDYRGGIRISLENFRGAVEDFTKVIQTHSNHANAYNNRGFARFRLGDFKEAIKDYSQASEFSPSFAVAYRNRGNAYSRIGDSRKAIEDYEIAASLFKEQGDLDAYNTTQGLIQKLQQSLKLRT